MAEDAKQHLKDQLRACDVAPSVVDKLLADLMLESVQDFLHIFGSAWFDLAKPIPTVVDNDLFKSIKSSFAENTPNLNQCIFQQAGRVNRCWAELYRAYQETATADGGATAAPPAKATSDQDDDTPMPPDERLALEEAVEVQYQLSLPTELDPSDVELKRASADTKQMRFRSLSGVSSRADDSEEKRHKRHALAGGTWSKKAPIATAICGPAVLLLQLQVFLHGLLLVGQFVKTPTDFKGDHGNTIKGKVWCCLKSTQAWYGAVMLALATADFSVVKAGEEKIRKQWPRLLKEGFNLSSVIFKSIESLTSLLLPHVGNKSGAADEEKADIKDPTLFHPGSRFPRFNKWGEPLDEKGNLVAKNPPNNSWWKRKRNNDQDWDGDGAGEEPATKHPKAGKKGGKKGGKGRPTECSPLSSSSSSCPAAVASTDNSKTKTTHSLAVSASEHPTDQKLAIRPVRVRQLEIQFNRISPVSIFEHANESETPSQPVAMAPRLSLPSQPTTTCSIPRELSVNVEVPTNRHARPIGSNSHEAFPNGILPTPTIHRTPVNLSHKDDNITRRVEEMKQTQAIRNCISCLQDMIVEESKSCKYERPTTNNLNKGFACGQPRFSMHGPQIVAEESDCLKQIEEAKTVQHPSSSSSTSVDASLRAAARWTTRHGPNVARIRGQKLADFERLAHSVADLSDALINMMPPHVRAAAGQLRLALLLAIIPALDWPDDGEDGLVNSFVQGFRTTGAVADSKVFRKKHTPASNPWPQDPEARKASNLEWTKKSIDLLKKQYKSGDPEFQLDASDLYARTQKEVEMKTVSGPYSRAQMDRRWGRGRWRAMKRFGVWQNGEPRSDEAKLRPVDNAAGSGHNAATEMRETITTEKSDFPVVMCQVYEECYQELVDPASCSNDCPDGLLPCELPGGPIPPMMQHGGDDLEMAYRRIPNDGPEYNCIMLLNPASEEVEFYELSGHCFGLSSAPANFNRTPVLMVQICRRLFGVTCSSYFDDYNCAEPSYADSSGQRVIWEVHRIIGFMLSLEKHVDMKERNVFLGVETDFTDTHSERFVHVRPKPGRPKKLIKTLEKIVQKNCLPPSQAASVRGKLQFLLSSAYGRVGRAALQCFVDRQYYDHRNELTDELRAAIEFFLQLLPQLPDRKIPIDKTSEPPLLVWSDASYEGGKGILGWVVFDPRSQEFFHSSYECPQSLLDEFIVKKTYIGQLEILAASAAFSSMPSIRNRDCVLFVDNVSAISCLVSGYSRKLDSARLVNEFHLRNAVAQNNIWIAHVRSAANVADLPSRGEFKLLESLNSRPVEMKIPNFSSWMVG